jgi:hypothetical protein
MLSRTEWRAETYQAPAGDFEPEAATAVCGFGCDAERARECLAMPVIRIRAAEYDSQALVVHQQRAQHILLVPAAVLVDNPVFGVVRRQEDVVDVDAHAGLEPRHDLEEETVDVAAGLRDVRGIDEENVAARERIEDIQRNILHLRPDQLDADLSEKRPRIRLDRRDLRRAVEKAAHDIGHQQRRIARTDLDDARRPPRAQQHEQRARIEPAELRIADVVRQEFVVRRACLEVIEFGIETREQRFEHVAVRCLRSRCPATSAGGCGQMRAACAAASAGSTIGE